MVVHPTSNMKIKPLAGPKAEWHCAVESIRIAGEYAAPRGVGFLECWNRFVSYFLDRLEQTRALWAHIELTNGGVQGDTFHTNIESVLQHVHLADSDRTAPGGELIEFEPIIDALVEISYDDKSLSFELLPAAADPFSGGRHEELFDRYTERALRTSKAVEELVRTRRTLAGKV